MSRVALPPGIYSIQTTTESPPRAVINAGNAGQQLSVGGVITTDPKQQWSVVGDGSIVPMNAPIQYAITTSPSTPAVPVSNGSHHYRWIINVMSNSDGSFTGWIMCRDSKIYWSLQGTGTNTQIQMNSAASFLRFVPV